MLIGVYRVDIPSYEDALALRHALRLHYEVHLCTLLLIVVDLVLQLSHLVGEEPRLGKELVLLRKLLLHFLQVASQIVLPRNLKHAGEVIDALVRLYLLKEVERWSHIRPLDVPLGPWEPRVALADDPPAEDLATDFLDNVILCVYREYGVTTSY